MREFVEQGGEDSNEEVKDLLRTIIEEADRIKLEKKSRENLN